MADDDGWCFDSESPAMHQVNSSAFPDGSLFGRGFSGFLQSHPASSFDSDDFGDLEQGLDRELDADSLNPIPESLHEQSQPGTPELDTVTFHKAAPPVGPLHVAAGVASSHEPQHVPRVNEVAFDMWMRQKRSCPWAEGQVQPSYQPISARILRSDLCPMSTGEACLYLREIMTGSGFDLADPQQLGCHSLKCTLLTWLAMGSYASISDRRLAGHHLDSNNVSPVTYSRDELTRVLAIERRMIKDIRKKKFKPDQPRIQRLPDLVAASGDLDEHPHIMVESDGEDEDPDETDLVRSDLPDHVRMSFDDLTLKAIKNCRIHRNSGVCHILDDDSKFKCGRKSTRNYHDIAAGTTIADVPICLQCTRSLEQDA
eukprot:symbB.v1.2.026372.t1/scaffold2629.1/size74438/2